jgi:Tfp pilus assembly protein FimV
MFGYPLDIERLFGHDRPMGRTRVRRRRLAAVCLVLGFAGVLSGPVANAVGADGVSRPEASRTYVVRPGDTLWSIATRFAPSADPRIVVDAVRSANAVDPGSLMPGQQLSLPSVG